MSPVIRLVTHDKSAVVTGIDNERLEGQTEEMVLTSTPPKSAVSTDGDTGPITVDSQRSSVEVRNHTNDISQVDDEACCSHTIAVVDEKLSGEDQSYELNLNGVDDEEEILRDFRSNVLAWIDNDSSRYIDEGENSHMEAKTSLIAVPKAKQVKENESVKDTSTNEIIDTSSDVVMNAATNNIKDITLTGTLKTEDTSKTDGITDISTTQGVTYTSTTGGVTKISTTETIINKSTTKAITHTTTIEVTTDTSNTEEISTTEGVTNTSTMLVLSSHEMTGNNKEIEMKEDETTEHTVDINHEELGEKEEFYMAVEGDGIENSYVCAPSCSIDEVEAGKDEFYMAVEGDGHTEEAVCAPCTSYDEMTQLKEDVDFTEISGMVEETGCEKENICEADEKTVIREDTGYAPSPNSSNTESRNEEVDVCSEYTHNENKAYGKVECDTLKEESDTCMTDELKLDDGENQSSTCGVIEYENVKEERDEEEDVETEELAAATLLVGEDGGDEGTEEAICSLYSCPVETGNEEEDAARTEEEDGCEEEDASPLCPRSNTGDSSVMNLADELAAAMGNLDGDQLSDNPAETSSEPDSVNVTDISGATPEYEASERKKRRLQESDVSDTQSQVAALHSQVAELQLANRDIKEKLESCECRLSDATVALTVRVESLRDARSRIQYLENKHRLKDEMLTEVAERLDSLPEHVDAPELTARVDDLQKQLHAAMDNLCAAEMRIQKLTEDLAVQVELNESLQASVKCKDEELRLAVEKTKMLESETQRQVEWRQSVDEVVTGLTRELESRTDTTETYAKEMGDAVEKMRVLQDELTERDNDLAEANEVIQSKQMQVDCETERNEALKIEMNAEECKALEQLIVTTEQLHEANEVNTTLKGEVSRKTELLSESETRVTALQDQLNADLEIQYAGLKAAQETTVVGDVNGHARDASFIMKADLLSDTMLDSASSFFDSTESHTDCSSESVDEKHVNADNSESSEVPLQQTMASLVKARQQHIQNQRDFAFGKTKDRQEQVSQLQGRIEQLNNAVRRMVEEKAALEAKIAVFRQEALEREEAHESEVFTLFENYVDLEDKLKEPVAVNTTATVTRKRASMFYHPEQDHDISLDRSIKDHSKEVANLKSALQESENMISATKLRAEADRQQLQATIEQLESKVSSQNEAHSVLVAEMESLHAFTWEMLVNERETHKSEVEQLHDTVEMERLNNNEISQKLSSLNEELNTLVDVKATLEDRLRMLEAEKEVWQAMLSRQKEEHEQELHRSMQNGEQEREMSRAELEMMRSSVEGHQSQEQLLLQRLQQLQEKLCSVTDLNESLVQEYENLKKRAAQLEANAEMKSNNDGKLDAQNMKCDVMTAEMNDLREKVGMLRQLSDDLREEKQVLIAEKEDVSEQLKALQAQAEKLNSELATLNAEKKNVDKELIDMATRVESLRKEKEAEVDVIDRLTEQVTELKELSENLQQEKETMAEVNLKMLDDFELMEEQSEQLKQQVERLTEELEQHKKAGDQSNEYTETPPQLLDDSRKLDTPQGEDVEAGVSWPPTSADVTNSEGIQCITNMTPTGVKRKLEETGFDDDQPSKKSSESAPVDTCVSCEACAEQLQEKDTVLAEHQRSAADLDKDRMRQTSLCDELKEQQVKTEEELSHMREQLQEQRACLVEHERRAAELEVEKERLTTLCSEVREQLASAQDELQVKQMMNVESKDLSRKLATLETTCAEERQTVEQLLSTISALQDEKSILETDAAEMHRAVTDTNSTVADLHQSLKDLETRNESLDKKAAELEAKHAFLEQCRADNEGQLEVVRLSVSELEVQVGVLTSRLQEAEAQNQTLESKLNEAVSDVEEAKWCTRSLKEELAVTATYLEEANGAKSQNEQELERVKIQLEKAEAEKAETEERFITATATLQSESCTREEVEERLTGMVTLLESAQQHAASLEQKLTDTEEAAKEQTATIEAELGSLIVMQQESEMRTQQMGEQLKEMMQKMECAETELKDVKGEKIKLEERLQTIEEDLKEAQRNSAKLQDVESRLEEELADVRCQLNTATAAGEESQEEAKALRKEMGQLQDTFDALKVDNQMLQQAHEEAGDRLKEAEDKCAMKTEEIDRLNADLEEVAKENEKMVQLEASMRELCEERDVLQGKVTLLTSNARRMDRDMKRLQADYDKLYNDKHQAGEQVLRMQEEIGSSKKEIETLYERLKNEVDELNEKLAKKTKDETCYSSRYQSLLKRYIMLEEENDKLKDALEGPVVIPPRASRRLKAVVTRAGAKRSGSDADASAMPKKILRGQTQKQQSIIITTDCQDVPDCVTPLKPVRQSTCAVDVKRNNPAKKLKSLGEASSEEWVTTRQRSRANSDGLKQKTPEKKVPCDKFPDLEQRALAVISNSPRKVPPVMLPADAVCKPPVVTSLSERTMQTRQSQGRRDTATAKHDAENCKVQ